MDSDRVYAVTDVINIKQSVINDDCEDNDEPNLDETHNTIRDSALYKSVSRIMIEQFFTEIEGPDRDWQQEDYDEYLDIDRQDLIITD